MYVGTEGFVQIYMSIYVQCVHIVEKPGHKPAGISYKTIKHISVRRYEHINVVLHYPFFPTYLN